jgi:hypothetical protein
VKQDVGIAMALEPEIERNANPAQRQSAALHESMNVKAMSNSNTH